MIILHAFTSNLPCYLLLLLMPTASSNEHIRYYDKRLDQWWTGITEKQSYKRYILRAQSLLALLNFQSTDKILQNIVQR